MHASARALKGVVATSLLVLGVLYAFYPFAERLSAGVREVISLLSSVTQLVFAVGIVTMHFNLLVAAAEEANHKVQQLLSTALDEFIPICMVCHSVKRDDGSWARLEAYLTEHGSDKVSHGVCPDCLPELRSDVLSQ